MLHEFQPILWCVTRTLAQEELPRDLSVLRSPAKEHRGCLGVYTQLTMQMVGDAHVDESETAAESYPIIIRS
jgi:hypothetical protein